MIKVIYFDLGGVIFKDFFSGGEEKLSKALGISLDEVLRAYVKTDVSEYCKDALSDEERWKNFVQELGLPVTKIPTCIDEFYKSYKLFPESFAFLENLKKTNTYQLGVLSDQPMGVAHYLRKEFAEIMSLFTPSLVLISAEIKLSKKDPNHEIYHFAIEKAGIAPEEILFVDNSLHNIENAQAAGLKTYFFDIKNHPIPLLWEGLKKNF